MTERGEPLRTEGHAGVPLPPPPPARPAEPPFAWQAPAGVAATVEGAAYRVAWLRAVAFALDMSLVLLPAWLLRAATRSQEPSAALGAALSLAYFLWFWIRPGGATPGMRLLRLRLAREGDDAPIPPRRAAVRFALLVPPVAAAGLVAPMDLLWGWVVWIWIAVLAGSTAINSRRRGFHDQGADSQVAATGTAGAGRVALGILLLLAASVALIKAFP